MNGRPDLPAGVLRPEDFPDYDSVQRHLPGLPWKEFRPDSGGRIAFCALGGSRKTGNISVLVALDGAAAPEHIHLADGTCVYREMIIGVSGAMEDVDDEGNRVTIGPGDMLFHSTPAPHAPKATRFALVYYHQPVGWEATTR